jgi:hypothetical protein
MNSNSSSASEDFAPRSPAPLFHASRRSAHWRPTQPPAAFRGRQRAQRPLAQAPRAESPQNRARAHSVAPSFLCSTRARPGGVPHARLVNYSSSPSIVNADNSAMSREDCRRRPCTRRSQSATHPCLCSSTRVGVTMRPHRYRLSRCDSRVAPATPSSSRRVAGVVPRQNSVRSNASVFSMI